MSRYRFIEAQRNHYPVRLLCQLAQVPASICRPAGAQASVAECFDYQLPYFAY